MIVSLIVAMDERGGIGAGGRLPWHLPSDLRRFKALTMGHHLIMGRKTFESIGKPLPGRTIIVLTKDPHPLPPSPVSRERGLGGEGLFFAHSLSAALDIARQRGESEVFVCGGGEIYRQALPLAGRIYLTQVHTLAAADTFFPAFERGEWLETEAAYHAAGEKDPYPYSFVLLERKP